MIAEVNIPDEAVNIGWHEFRYPRPAVDEPSAAFLRGLTAAAPLIVAARLEQLVAELTVIQQEMREEDNRTVRSYGLGEGIRRLCDEVAKLRGESL